ncbi:hypothetical protein FQN60_009938, partial [Etheostoma spectabile]
MSVRKLELAAPPTHDRLQRPWRPRQKGVCAAIRSDGLNVNEPEKEQSLESKSVICTLGSSLM